MSIMDLVRRKKPTSLIPEESTPFTLFRSQMNQLLDSFGSEWPTHGFSGQAMGAFVPSVEVSESDKFVDVTAELPGMTDKDIGVMLSADASLLTIQGEKKFEEERKDDSFYRFERSYGSFKRTISLPSAVDEKGAEASFKNGVLTLHMPKLPQEQQGIKKIAVKAGS